MNTETMNSAADNAQPENNVYIVESRAAKLSVPRKCTSCLESTKYIEKLSTYRGISKIINKKRNMYYKTPICSKCLKIRRNHRKQLMLLFCLSVFIPYLAFIIMASFIPGYVPLAITAALYTVSFLALMTLVKPKDIGNACTRLKSAKVKWISKRRIAFTFSSKEYADMFYEANPEYANPPQPRKHKSTKNASSYISTIPYPALLFTLGLAITAVLSVYTMPIIASFENFGKSSGMSPSEIAMKNESINDFEADEATQNNPKKEIEDKVKSDAASAETTAPTTPVFSVDLPAGTNTHADVVSIIPSVNLSDPATGGSWVICKCTTAEDKVIYIGLSSKNYNTLIDSTANLANTKNATLKTVTFDPPKRFNGTTAQAEAVCRGLSQAIGTNVVMDFVSMD